MITLSSANTDEVTERIMYPEQRWNDVRQFEIWFSICDGYGIVTQSEWTTPFIKNGLPSEGEQYLDRRILATLSRRQGLEQLSI